MEEQKTNLQPFKRRGAKPVATLTDAQRLAAVLRSQGITRVAEIAAIPDAVKAELVAICNADGTFVAVVRFKADAILDAYYDSCKAAVDKPTITVKVTEAPLSGDLAALGGLSPGVQ